MTSKDSTPKPPTLPAQSVNNALNLHWFYFMSIGGDLLIKQFATDSLAEHPNFKIITQEEYEFLVSEMQS